MQELESGIYGKPKFGLIVWMFAIAIIIALILGWFFLRSGQPAMHTQPQPKDNKGALVMPVPGLNV